MGNGRIRCTCAARHCWSVYVVEKEKRIGEKAILAYMRVSSINSCLIIHFSRPRARSVSLYRTSRSLTRTIVNRCMLIYSLNLSFPFLFTGLQLVFHLIGKVGFFFFFFFVVLFWKESIRTTSFNQIGIIEINWEIPCRLSNNKRRCWYSLFGIFMVMNSWCSNRERLSTCWQEKTKASINYVHWLFYNLLMVIWK